MCLDEETDKYHTNQVPVLQSLEKTDKTKQREYLKMEPSSLCQCGNSLTIKGVWIKLIICKFFRKTATER